MIWLQAFDSSGANAVPYQRLDYTRLAAWLEAILSLDERSLYPLFSAARVYAENADPAKMRGMLQFIHSAFQADPNARWPALAHAAMLAKHRLRDLPLARRYAADLQRLTTDPGVPQWAKQMEIFVLEDMDELEAARVMLGGCWPRAGSATPQNAGFWRIASRRWKKGSGREIVKNVEKSSKVSRFRHPTLRSLQ